MRSAATLIQLRAFVAAAATGSFGQAAIVLGLSPSSVSESVKALEHLHGQPLFRRSPRGITLTPAGEQGLYYAQLVVQHSEDFALAVDERRALEGSLTVATFRSLGVHLLPPVLALLRRRHPRLQVRIIDGTLGAGGEQLVQDGQADVAFLELGAPTSLFTLPVVQDDYVAVRVRAEEGQPLSVATLRAQPLLVFPAEHACNAGLHRHLHSFLLPGTVVQEIADDEVMLSMVEHRLGLAVMPRLAVLPLRESLTMSPLPVALSRTLGVAMKPGRPGLPHLRAFVEALRAYQTTPAFADLQALVGAHAPEHETQALR
ncbi:LysR family transcriptional regulator [Deinococcus ruber]|uniref:LysR family transcriptional regulator n=1 Tax=Deinococcus ruber TaxID=1848197 RepID=A0A918CGI9_9DEIO|nr:LysR family transcriptional regulator [Deinococcus ruber]GGR20400.1 LysR family transcriptional regulator [Deinococcus ruber]